MLICKILFYKMLKFFIILIIFAASVKQSYGEVLDISHTFCMNAYNTGSQLQLVPASEGETIELECQFCRPGKDKDLDGPYFWYQKDLQNGSKELSVNVTSNDRLSLSAYVLVIKSFNAVHDAKRYSCRSGVNEKLQASSNIEYLVDALRPSLAPTVIVSGNSSALSNFEQRHIAPLASFVQKELSSMIKMQWSKPSLCQDCSSDVGHRLARGHCILQTNSSKFPYNLSELSCRSTLLQPHISDVLSAKLLAIPDFDLEEPCDCPKLVAAADTEGGNQSFTFFLSEGAKWDIKCPLMKYPGAHVDWYKDDTLLNARVTQPEDSRCSFWCKCGNIYVSPYRHDLTVNFAASSIEGIYSCHSDNKKWKFEIRVYGVTGFCDITTNGILIIITLLLIPVIIFCCVLMKIQKCCDPVETVSLNTSDMRVVGQNITPVGNPVPIRMDVLFQPMQRITQPMQPVTSTDYTPSALVQEPPRTTQASSTMRGQLTQQSAPESQRADTRVTQSRQTQRSDNHRPWRSGPAPTPGSM